MRLLLKLLGLVVLLFGCFGQGRASAKSSPAYRIRKALLTDYDKGVIPSPENGSSLNVLFGLKIKKLVKVDNKEQLLSIETWIIMRWNNTFLKWDKSKYNGVNGVQFSPTEIWFPDISLYNNGDSEVPRAGGTSIFLSDVKVNSDGECTFSGPATFKVNCEMKLNTYPFDKQTCEMRFGSYNYAMNMLRIKVFKTKSKKIDQFVENGDWNLQDLITSTGKTDHGDCCPYQFSQISYTVEMSRRFEYHMFYLVAPCAIIAVMALFSFFIPTESGERIGFVTTLMLAMMVFLLIIPESLPESSKSIPILGVLMMTTLIMIGLVLLSTILILKCFYSKRKAPQFFRKKFGRTKSHKHVVNIPPESDGGIDNINLRAVLPKSQDSKQAFEPTVKSQEVDNEATWQYISRLCDKIMFAVFLIFTIVMYTVTMTYRDKT